VTVSGEAEWPEVADAVIEALYSIENCSIGGTMKTISRLLIVLCLAGLGGCYVDPALSGPASVEVGVSTYEPHRHYYPYRDGWYYERPYRPAPSPYYGYWYRSRPPYYYGG